MTLAEGFAERSILPFITSSIKGICKEAHKSKNKFQSFSPLTSVLLTHTTSNSPKKHSSQLLQYAKPHVWYPVCYYLFCGKQRKIFCVCYQIFSVESVILSNPPCSKTMQAAVLLSQEHKSKKMHLMLYVDFTTVTGNSDRHRAMLQLTSSR